MIDSPHNNTFFLIRFFNEIALYSGQYALFYLFMQFSSNEIFWLNIGHVILLLSLIVQTSALVYYGENIRYRVVLSFLSLLVYTTFEWSEDGVNSLLTIGHLFFWVTTLLLVILQVISHTTQHQKIRFSVEFLVSNINIFIFIFIYFYFDLKLNLEKELALGTISQAYAHEELFVWRLADGFGEFLEDPAHVYIILGGIFLSFTIAYSRIKILLLSDKIDSLLVRYIGEETRDILVKKNSGTLSTRIKSTLLYADIRNFTTLSEKEDASRIVAILNFYYARWHQIIKAHNGMINKFIGDALLAFFEIKEDAKQSNNEAVRSALTMLESLEGINEELLNMGLAPLDGIGIGIHYGEVILGDIGGERKDYTLIGDTVNTVARLETLCKVYQSPLIISQSCYDLLEPLLKQKFTYLSSLALKGKEEKVTFYGLKS